MEKEKKKTIGLCVTGILLAGLGCYCAYDEIRMAQTERELKESKRRESDLREENTGLRGENRALHQENKRLGRENGNLIYHLGKKVAEKEIKEKNG